MKQSQDSNPTGQPHGCVLVLAVVSALVLALYAGLNFGGHVHFLEMAPQNETILSLSYLIMSVVNVPVIFSFYIVPRKWSAYTFCGLSAFTGLGALVPSLPWLEKGPQGAGTAAAGIGFLIGLVVFMAGASGLASAYFILPFLRQSEKGGPNQRPEGTPGKSSPSKPSQVPGAPHP
jgi:hypothetical protein